MLTIDDLMGKNDDFANNLQVFIDIDSDRMMKGKTCCDSTQTHVSWKFRLDERSLNSINLQKHCYRSTVLCVVDIFSAY